MGTRIRGGKEEAMLGFSKVGRGCYGMVAAL